MCACSEPQSLGSFLNSFECMVLGHYLWFGDLLQCIKSSRWAGRFPGSWHRGWELCIGHPLDVRKAKVPSAKPTCFFQGKLLLCSVWPLPGFLVGRGWVCCGLSALSWGSHDSPGEWIGLSKKAVGVYTPWMVLLGLSQARPFWADHRMDRNLLRCDLWCPRALLGPAEGGTLRWC